VGLDARTGAPTTIDGPTDQTNVHNGATYQVRAGRRTCCRWIRRTSSRTSSSS
jgi:hypothetical protein